MREEKKKEKSIEKTALITDTTDGRQYHPGTMLKRLMLRQGVSRKELHRMVQEKHPVFESPTMISDFCNDYHVRHISHTYVEILITCLGMPKTLTRYYTCEFLKSLLDPSLHKYVDAPKRLVKPIVMASLAEELRAELVLKEEVIKKLHSQNVLLTKQISEQAHRERQTQLEAHLKSIKQQYINKTQRIDSEQDRMIAEFELQEKSSYAQDYFVELMIEEQAEREHKEYEESINDSYINGITPEVPQFLSPFGRLIDYPDTMELARFCIRDTKAYKELKNFLLGSFIYVPGTSPPHNVTIQFMNRFNDCRSAESIFVAYVNHFFPTLELTNVIRNQKLFDECFLKYWETVCKLLELMGPTASVIINPLKSLQISDPVDEYIAKARLSGALQASYGKFTDSDQALLTNYDSYLQMIEPLPPVTDVKRLVTAGVLIHSDYPMMKPFQLTTIAEVQHEEVRLTLDSIYYLKDLPKPPISLLDKLDQYLIGELTRVEIEHAASLVHADINKYELRQAVIEDLATVEEFNNLPDDVQVKTWSTVLGKSMAMLILFENTKVEFDFL